MHASCVCSQMQVGRMLANTLRYAFFDTDTMIEMTHDKKPVSEIFIDYGEDYFRNCEAEVLKQLAPYKNLVVSTGGGAVIRPMNWSYLHAGKMGHVHAASPLWMYALKKKGALGT